MNKIKIIIFFSFLSIILTGISWAYAQTSTLEVVYPTLSHAPNPALLDYLPNYIKYIYFFIVGTGGMIALVVLVMAGFRYLTSAGNPSIMTDSRNQIFSALIGLVILFGSYVLLNELDPQTLVIEPPSLIAAGMGIIVYSDDNCGDNSDALPNIVKELPAGTKFLRIEATSGVGEKEFGTESFSVGSFYTFNSHKDFTIEFYGNKDCENDWIETVPNDALQTFGAKTCISNIKWGGKIEPVKCIKILWHKPGVYVYSYPGGNPEERVPPGECFEIYQNSRGDLPDCLDDKVGSIALIDDEDNQIKYGVVLHNLPRAAFGNDFRGWAHVYMPKNGQKITLYDTVSTHLLNNGKDAGSLTVFQVNEKAIESSVQICRNDDCEAPQTKSYVPVTFDWAGGWKREEINGNVSSGAEGLLELSNLSTNIGYNSSSPIVKGVRFISPTKDDFDGNWCDSDPISIYDHKCHADRKEPTRDDMTIVSNGISAIKFLRQGTTYLAILYDRADAVTDTDWREPGILHPGGNALLFGTSKPSLSQLGYSDCAGSLLLIKADIQ